MDADLHWTEADAELARAETLALLKRECPKCPDLDELLTILRAPDIAGALGERPEHEYSIAWMPTFTDESLGDAGEDWEVLITARTGLNRSAVVEVALRQLHAAGSIPFADPPAAPSGPPAKSAKRG
jgi:hypothetical protein